MSSPRIAACPSSESRKVSRRARCPPLFSPDSSENRRGPGPGDAAVMTRSCRRVVANHLSPTCRRTQETAKRISREENLPSVAPPSRRDAGAYPRCLPKDGGQHSFHSAEKAAVLRLGLLLRRWRLNYGIEVHLTGRRILHRQISGGLQGRG